jgi:lysophospholipase L1-like esterase
MLALGDSYTIGQSVAEADRFPNQTIGLLNNKQMDFAYPSTIVATTGWTTRNLLDGITSANLPSTYDVVTLLIGVNNQYQHVDTNTYKNEFPILLKKAIGFAKGLKTHVFVLSIPDYSVTPFGRNDPAISTEIAHYNALCKTMTEQMGVAFVDITPISQMAATDQTLTASDGLHPSGKQYALWAGLLWPKVYDVLK